MLYLIAANLIGLTVIIIIIRRYCMRRSAQRTLERIMNHINAGFYRYRVKDGVILMANRGFVKILELDMTPKEVIGRSISELIIYVDDESLIRNQIRDNKELRNYEYRFKTLKGKDKVVLHNSYLVKDPGTGEEAIEALIEDITEEKLFLEKMQESQERYQKLFKESGDMVLICSLDNFIIDEVNPVTYARTGFLEEDLLNRPLKEFIHPSKRNRLEECRKDLMFKGHSRLETVIVCNNGIYRDVLLTLNVVEIKDSTIVMVIVKDISAIVKGREEDKRRKKELEEFCNAAIEREDRIKNLRYDLEKTRQQLKKMKQRYEED